ncbi:hypothetical protein N7510_009125 [Penicillium lagena]|uniref:uncharacterized protein n=1 Tax=Penicillium lagena TaxID=94218 RepID=UPI0025402B05|nr:uncharacterized protein N7510_009125 [Penicillium lagena]KAJ5606344.1 hypothetical protein N7510_009125 [Penicillium lagena]
MPSMAPESIELLEHYAGVSKNDMEKHIYSIRDEAWDIMPYPCIGAFMFLTLRLCALPEYPALLSRLKNGHTFLDLGCCFGQDIRKLIFDGVPADQLLGCDYERSLLEVGFALFHDKDTMFNRFIDADFFDDHGKLFQHKQTFDIIHIAMFLHLMNRHTQLLAIDRIFSLISKKPGSLIMGSQIGSFQAGEEPLRHDAAKTVFLHNESSFQNLWREAAKEKNLRLKINMTINKSQTDALKPTIDEKDGKIRDIYFTGPKFNYYDFIIELL